MCHRGEVNTAHKVKLFVIQYFKEMKGVVRGGGQVFNSGKG